MQLTAISASAVITVLNLEHSVRSLSNKLMSKPVSPLSKPFHFKKFLFSLSQSFMLLSLSHSSSNIFHPPEERLHEESPLSILFIFLFSFSFYSIHLFLYLPYSSNILFSLLFKFPHIPYILYFLQSSKG